VCARKSTGSHRARRSLWLKLVSRVDVGAVGVVGGQQLGLLALWMNSPRPDDPPGVAVMPLVP
jgi:hypothetical protein